MDTSQQKNKALLPGDAIEAIAYLDDQSDFDSIINVQSCYVVNNYASTPQRRYMPAVPHKSCLRIGKVTSFVPITNCNIPDHYYSFADFSVLEIRMRPQKMLTDYIGRIEKNEHTTTRSGKKLKKITIKDER
ncbi:hypothetical protein M8C21_004498 [Ambrosia artemisiifolia]|uniref:Uncharacterized protein n=1 Tax=Ambrosia artemisiifolia TaxID=4212 RepID=A0AAD5GQ62_AMBAR|nr:hypothetical protein M8C21_004498 [Ambrosia artemisiifolia]